MNILEHITNFTNTNFITTMKKKLMMVAVLLGALSLGACVDDNESASVTAVREAKAAQLNSIAAMNNAEAEAKLIYAEAEAQLKAAEAALQQALADKVAAEAKIKELEAQMAEDAYDAELAARLAQAEQERLTAEAAIARINGELQYYQMDLERRIAELQKELLQAQMDLQNKQDDIASQEMARLNKLAKNYSTLLYSVTEEKQSLAQLEAGKLALEAELADWQVEKEQSIAENNATIAFIDQQIALYKEYTNYTENLDALQQDKNLKEAQRDQLADKKNALYKTYNEALNAREDDEKLAEMLNAINEHELMALYNNRWSNDYIYPGPGAYIYFGNYCPIQNFDNENVDAFAGTKEEYGTYFLPAYTLEVEAQDLRQLDLLVKDAIAALDIKTLEENINAAETGTKALWEAAKKATTDAKSAWDAKPEDADLEEAYRQALSAEEFAKWQYNYSVDQLEEAEANKEKVETLYNLVKSSTADLEKAVADYNAAVLEAAAPELDAYCAWKDGEEAYNELDAEIAAINAVLYGQGEEQITLIEYIQNQLGENIYLSYYNNIYVDVFDLNNGWSNYQTGIWINMWSTFVTTNAGELDGAINIQNLIDALETQKETLLAANEDYSAATTKEELIEKKQAEIDGKKAIVNILDIQLAQAKAALDAAIAEYDTEEAPAA